MTPLKRGDRVVWIGEHSDAHLLNHTFYGRAGTIRRVSGEVVYVAFDGEDEPKAGRSCAEYNLQRLRSDENEQVFGG